MNYPHLSPETATECSRVAYAYSHDCYCIIYWACADYLPRPQYHGLATKWLCASVYRAGGPEQGDRYVLGVSADTGPELLNNLRTALDAIINGEQPDPSLVATEHAWQQLSAVLRHPLLGTGMLLHTLDRLLPDLPVHRVFDLTKRLQRVINNREQEVYQPPEGNGWIASASQTTQELRAWY